MTMTRSHAVTAGIAAAAALTATGITYAAAASAPEARTVPTAVQQAPVQAPLDGGVGKGHEGKDHDDHDKGHKKHRKHHDEGWIHINERSYSAHPSGCVTVISGLGSKTFNIRNDSRRTVEVFRGATCDNGAPIATVGPHSTSNGVEPGKSHSVKVKDGVIASFRVVHHHGHDEGGYDHGGKGDH
ncbi:hypothetical protein M3765_23930 [Streptomyces thermoviolaceus]|nr:MULTISPECIES: hypothetical protein [Streptomyces]MCM3266995.1 hypothetical protein [Streptomyces thermoviolaceus]WTD50583.1 hypothetical protein OG899_25540 [Streptomyces thermoviolaceus]GHB14027.1 hypothetical protein GCM10010512_51660 [Streptomyces thermoviolaceus subsp. thermoviolaceus]